MLVMVTLQKRKIVFLRENKRLWAWAMVASAGSNTTVQLLIQPEASIHHPEKTPKGPPYGCYKCLQRSGFLLRAAGLSGVLVPKVTSAGRCLPGHTETHIVPGRTAPMSPSMWRLCDPSSLCIEPNNSSRVHCS